MSHRGPQRAERRDQFLCPSSLDRGRPPVGGPARCTVEMSAKISSRNVLRSVSNSRRLAAVLCTSVCKHTKLPGPTEKRTDINCQYTKLGPPRLGHAFQKPDDTAVLKSMLAAQLDLTSVMVCMNLIVDLEIIPVLLRLVNEDQIKTALLQS